MEQLLWSETDSEQKLYSVCLTGDVCMAGQYCPAGSANGTYCPPGTYLDTTGARQESDCLACTQGQYCDGYGNDLPTGSCDAGYYCPTGMNVSSPAEYTCPEGRWQ